MADMFRFNLTLAQMREVSKVISAVRDARYNKGNVDEQLIEIADKLEKATKYVEDNKPLTAKETDELVEWALQEVK